MDIYTDINNAVANINTSMTHFLIYNLEGNIYYYLWIISELSLSPNYLVCQLLFSLSLLTNSLLSLSLVTNWRLSQVTISSKRLEVNFT